MAFVGPLTSLVLGGVFTLSIASPTPRSSISGSRVFHLAYLNVVLGLFNLLPAFPMDGGRILRGARRAVGPPPGDTAAAGGKGVRGPVRDRRFRVSELLLMAVAFFVYVGAEAESRNVLVKAVLGHIRVRDLAGSQPRPVEPRCRYSSSGSGCFASAASRFRGRGRTRAGVVGLEDVQRVLLADREHIRVSDVVRRVAPVDASDEASKALRAFAEARTPLVPVVENGELLGVLSTRTSRAGCSSASSRRRSIRRIPGCRRHGAACRERNSTPKHRRPPRAPDPVNDRTSSSRGPRPGDAYVNSS